MLPLVEDQASCIDECYLLVINFMCKTRPKVIGSDEFKYKADFDLLIIFIYIKTDQRRSRMGSSKSRSI